MIQVALEAVPDVRPPVRGDARSSPSAEGFAEELGRRLEGSEVPPEARAEADAARSEGQARHPEEGAEAEAPVTVEAAREASTRGAPPENGVLRTPASAGAVVARAASGLAAQAEATAVGRSVQAEGHAGARGETPEGTATSAADGRAVQAAGRGASAAAAVPGAAVASADAPATSAREALAGAPASPRTSPADGATARAAELPEAALATAVAAAGKAEHGAAPGTPAASRGGERTSSLESMLERFTAGAAAEQARAGAQGTDAETAGQQDPRGASQNASQTLSPPHAAVASDLAGAGPQPRFDALLDAARGPEGLPASVVPSPGAAPAPATPGIEGSSTPAAVPLHVTALATRGGGTARLQLHPPNLGELHVRVTLRGSAVEIAMVAHEPAAQALIQAGREALGDALAARDLRMESFDVSLAQRDDAEGRALSQRSSDHGQEDGWRGGDRRGARSALAGGALASGGASSAPAAWFGSGAAQGRVDLRV